MLVKAVTRNIDVNLNSDTVEAYDTFGNCLCTFTTNRNMSMSM